MGTEIYVNTLKASSSIKDFNKVLQNTKAEWKALSSAEKFAGNSLGSLKTKYDGLGKEINLTKDKITKLKAEQAKLNDSNTGAIKKYNEYGAQIKKLQEQQGKLDTSTKEGRDSYDKLAKKIDETRQAQSKNTGVTEKDAKAYLGLEKQINTAKNQITGYQKQQEKTANSMKYYTSGLEKLQKEHKLATASSQAYVDRLQAEGKTTEANKAKMVGLKDSLSNLSKQYDKQEDELKQIAKASGKASDAYKEQKIRLDKTGTSVANTKGDISKLQSTINKTSGNPFKRLTEKIKGTNKEAEKSHSIFKSVFSANIASNAISSAWTAISSKMGDAISVGNEYLEQQDKMSAQWKTLTGSVKGSKEMTSAINDLATSAQNSAEMVNGLASQFYAVDKNKDHVINLSKATLTLQDAFGATDDEIQNFGKQWSQMMANGKVSAQDFMSFTNVFPALKPALLDYEKDVTHNSKLTMKQLNDMISQGKISSETMNKVLTETAKKNSKATENFGKTIPGMTRTITATMPKLIGEIEKPFYKMKNPLVGSISKWVADKNTAKEFSKLGKALTATINDFTSAFGGSKLDGGKLMDKMLKGLTNSIKDLGKWAKTHKKDIQEFFGSFREKSADTIKVLGATMEAFGKVTLPIIKEMAKHPKVAGTFLAGFMIANKLTGPIAAIGALSTSIGKLAKLPKKMIFKPEVDGGGVRDGLKKVGSTIKSAGSGIKKGLKWSAEVVTTGAKKVVSGLGKVFTTAGKGAKKALQFTAKVAVKGAQKAMRGLVKTAQITGKGLKAAFAFLKANPLILLVSAIVAVVVALVELYKHNKKFRKFVNGLIDSAKAAFKGVVKWFGNMKDGVVKHVSNLWNGTKKHFSNGWNNVKSLTSKGVSAVKNHFNDMKNRATGAAKSLWNTANKDFRNGAKVNQNVTKTMKDVVTGHWGRLGGDVKGIASSLKNAVADHFRGMYNTLNKLTGGGLGKLTSAFSGFGKGVKNVFSSIKDSIQKHVKNGINGAIGFINGGIGGINKVIHTFGGSKNAIGKIKKLAAGGSGYRGIAMVNDGNGEEAIIKHGKAYKIKGKNALVKLEGDETVIPHEASHSMFGDSIAHYAKGTKNWFSSLTGWVKDKWDGIVNFIAHPINSLKTIMSKAMGKIKGSQFITKFTPAMTTGFIQGIWKKFKSMLQDLKTAHDDEGGSFDGKMGKFGVYAYLYNIAKKAMAKFGNMHVSSGYRPGDRYYHGKHQAIDIAFPASMNGSRKYKTVGDWVFDHFKKQVAYVITLNRVRDRKGLSGTGVHNGWTNWAEGGHMDHLHINGMWGPKDIGAGGGGKVTGSHKSLLKKAGFRANEIAAADWIVNVESSWNPNAVNPTSGAFGLAQSLGHGMAGHGTPIQQLKWMAGYIHGRYGTANKAKSFHKSHNWYANGGIVDKEQLAHIAENNQPEAIIPLSKMKRAQATKVLEDVRERFSDGSDSHNYHDKELEEQIQNLTDVVSGMKDLVAMILNVNSNTLQATKDGAFDKTKMYQQTANDINLANYQAH